MGFSLYVHIPYCESKCPYCDFNSYVVPSVPEADYTRALESELAFRAQQLPWAGNRIETIFFGGGTPSLFAPGSIRRVIETAAKLFGLQQNAEITIEANPGTVDKRKLLGYLEAGVNRISFGAQSFSPRLLKFLGRIHGPDQTCQAVAIAFDVGFERVNLDLIFAIPGQTVDELRRDLEQAIALKPDHISCYNLTFEPGTAFYTLLKRGRIKALPEDRQARMYEIVRTFLREHGYPMYELSNYAAAGHECRHNLTYWRRRPFLGIGAGAHSFADDERGGRRWWNERSPSVYIERVRTSGVGESGSEEIDIRTAQREFVFLNLRLREGFALADFRARFGQDFYDVFGSSVKHMFDGGLLVEQEGRVRLSEDAVALADAVSAEFF